MPLPLRLLKRFNVWRARRIYRRITTMCNATVRKAERMKRKADRLIGDAVKPPMPLMDWADRGGR